MNGVIMIKAVKLCQSDY